MFGNYGDENVIQLSNYLLIYIGIGNIDCYVYLDIYPQSTFIMIL